MLTCTYQFGCGVELILPNQNALHALLNHNYRDLEAETRLSAIFTSDVQANTSQNTVNAVWLHESDV